MIGLLLTIANISAGLLLGITILDKWDGESDFFNKINTVLVPFKTIIGVALVVLAILASNYIWLFKSINILGGLLLLTHVFSKVPSIEKELRKVSSGLMPFKAIIGIGLIIIGLFRLF